MTSTDTMQAALWDLADLLLQVTDTIMPTLPPDAQRDLEQIQLEVREVREVFEDV